jgi:leucyl/phenylalanyl-tRNA--protein transferase
VARPPDSALGSIWQFPPLHDLPPEEDFIAVGADLEPGTILGAYTQGYFPMPVDRRRIGWFSPDPRGVLRPSSLQVSRSLRRSTRRYSVSVNQAFDQVLAACSDPSRPNGWIDRRIKRAYARLHHLGWAHSVEVWDDDGLAGGLYGIGIGGLFAGESMFHRRTDASKVALVHLVELLGTGPATIIDVQWLTPHLASLGAEAVSRNEYRRLLTAALDQGSPMAPVPGSS